MNLVRILIAKDLRRIRRNPLAILIQIGIAMLLVTVIGLAFGPQAKSGSGMSPIKLSIVDEDESVFTQLLQNTVSSKEFSQYFDTHFLEREEALEKINDNELSAVLIIPEGFSDVFLAGNSREVDLELVKNPAQSIYPAVVEEGTKALLALLNALARNFGEELREWKGVLESAEETDFVSTTFIVAGLLQDTADRLEEIEDYLTPPLVTFESRTQSDGSDAEEGDFNLYSWLFAGMAGMFLLMISNSLTSDIYREARFGTLSRFVTLHDGLWALITGKMVLVTTIVLISAAIMFGGAALVFGFTWKNPLPVVAVVFGYGVCAAGLTSCIASIAAKEKRADTINTIVIMGLAVLGGTMFQVEDMPGFVRDYVSPHLPTTWFIGTIRSLQDVNVVTLWVGVSIKLCVAGVALAGVSSILFYRRLQKGVKSG